MRRVVVIRGPLGVGKTTIARKLCEKLKAKYFSIDTVLSELHLDTADEGGIPVKHFLIAQHSLLPRIETELSINKDVIIDGNFYYQEQIDYFSEHFGDKISIVTLSAPVEVCIERDSMRVKPHGEDATKAVHQLVSRITSGIVIDTAEKSVDDVVHELLRYIQSLE